MSFLVQQRVPFPPLAARPLGNVQVNNLAQTQPTAPWNNAQRQSSACPPSALAQIGSPGRLLSPQMPVGRTIQGSAQQQPRHDAQVGNPGRLLSPQMPVGRTLGHPNPRNGSGLWGHPGAWSATPTNNPADTVPAGRYVQQPSVQGYIQQQQRPAAIQPAGASLSPTQRKIQILCYGDSNTAGFPPPMTPYGKTLEEELRKRGYQCDVTVHGNSGASAKDLLAKASLSDIKDVTGTSHPGLKVLLGQRDWDLVVIMLGTNGLGQMQHEEEIMGYIKKLHELCHGRDVPTVVLAAVTIDVERDLWGLNKRRDRLAWLLCCYDEEDDFDPDEKRLAFLDPRDVMPRKPDFWAPDGFHFTQGGQRRFGQQVTPTIINALRKIGYE